MSDSGGKILGHNYDGIQEYDNPMPAWWKAIFLGTAIFAVGYTWYFHGGGGKSVHEDYADEMAVQAEKEAAVAASAIKESELLALMGDSAAIGTGKAKYTQSCVVCHGEAGEGKIGPNLTDKYWIHGDGSLLAIYKVVAGGVPDKGMPTWSKSLKPDDLAKVVAFIGSIRNTNVANGKAPQGNPIENAMAPAAHPGIAP